MTAEIVSRPYTSADRAACLALFDGNTPRFFAPKERAEFADFLSGAPSADAPYLVLVRDDVLIACGGLNREPDTRHVTLTWGMVDRTLQGQGLGTSLTKARLAAARAMSDVDELRLETSQHTRGFYERFGFEVTKVTPDGFGAGLDRYDMVCKLT